MIESSIKTMEEKNFDRVRLDLQGLLNRDENDIEAMYCMGLLMAKTDRLKEVQELSNKAIKIDPELAGPYAVLRETYYLTFRFDEAIEVSRKALKLDPNMVMTYKVIGEIYICQRKYDQNIAVLRQGAQLVPKNTKILLALVYTELGKGTKAAQFINSAELLYQKADNLTWTNKARQTKRVILKKFKIKPGDIGH